MKSRIPEDRWLALTFLSLGILLIFVWIPLDTDTGLVEKVRRKFIIGDALAPTVAGAVIMLGAFLTLLRPANNQTLNKQNLVWISVLSLVFITALLLMRFAGPYIFAGIDGGYRPLRATPPWNYIGFLAGGTLMIGSLTGLAKNQFAFRDFVVGFLAALAIALLYDIPFDDLILPPNGDV